MRPAICATDKPLELAIMTRQSDGAATLNDPIARRR
jgi:hypothetical protein